MTADKLQLGLINCVKLRNPLDESTFPQDQGKSPEFRREFRLFTKFRFSQFQRDSSKMVNTLGPSMDRLSKYFRQIMATKLVNTTSTSITGELKFAFSPNVNLF